MKIESQSIWIISKSLVTFFVVVAGGEIFARFYLGLGTPPLSMTHPTIEYMYKPNQDVYRFGNHFLTNEYSMRSNSLSKYKVSLDEIRIMIFGDSVINGGSLTDQSELATTILEDRLSVLLNTEIIVSNISAGSWGPGNWLAYAKEYGFFDADIVILVISSHDYIDNPNFFPLDKNTYPTQQPTLALLEGLQRYLPRFLATFLPLMEVQSPPPPKVNPVEIDKSLRDLTNFLLLAKQNSNSIFVFQHYENWELNHVDTEGYRYIKTTCEQLGIIPQSLKPYFNKAIKDGSNPYRDMIHPNELGQQIIAEVIFDKIQKTLQLEKK